MHILLFLASQRVNKFYANLISDSVDPFDLPQPELKQFFVSKSGGNDEMNYF